MTPVPGTGDHERKWRRFTRSMVAVLAASIVIVTATVAGVSVARILNLAEMDERRKAGDLARFVARTAFVAVSLENEGMLAKAVSPYLDDVDLVSITIKDAAGKTLYSRQVQADPPQGRMLKTSHPVRAPAETGSNGENAIGTVEVGVSMARAVDAVWSSVWTIALSSLGLLIAAIAVGLMLISGMTRRLKDLVGEAELAQELAQVNAELEAFSYSVSHDLRAPLRHIDGFIQMLEKRSAAGLDEQGKRYVSIIAGSSKRMGMLIDDLLAFSRTSRVEMRRARVALRPVVNQVIADLKTELEGRNVEWKIHDLPDVDGDEALLRQVYANLISNAVKFTSKQEKTVIEVGSAPAPRGQAQFFVRDNGAGFDPRYADKLFGVFQRLHSREEFEGTGIGLANVKRIVDRHGGRIWAESVPGKGATFFFTLPLRSREAVS